MIGMRVLDPRWIAVVVIAMAGCKNDTAEADLWSSVEPDSSVSPQIRVMVTPDHLRSGLDTTMTVSLGLIVYRVDIVDHTTIETQLGQAVSMVSLPGKKPVAGQLTVDADGKKASFAPSGIATDTDYLFRVKPMGYVTPDREYTLLHTGSLPRIRQVSFTKGGSGTLEIIALAFSEPVSPSQVSNTTVVTDLASNLALAHSAVNTNTSALTVGLKVPAGTTMTDKLRITVSTDVGAQSGILLDGLYTGQAGSGPLTVELVPVNYTDGKEWSPPLTF